MITAAAITADIIDSTKLSDKEINSVLENVNQLINNLKGVRLNIDNTLSIRRGDSIQGDTDNIEEALKIALLLKTTINRVNYSKGEKKSKIIDVRIAIGISEIIRRSNINESTGEAYIFSGRTLDSMKKDKRLIAIKTFNEKINAELDAELKLLEVVMERWTAATSEILFWMLWGEEEKKIAEKLGIKQPAISQGKKRAGWKGVEALLIRFKQLMEEIE